MFTPPIRGLDTTGSIIDPAYDVAPNYRDASPVLDFPRPVLVPFAPSIHSPGIRPPEMLNIDRVADTGVAPAPVLPLPAAPSQSGTPVLSGQSLLTAFRQYWPWLLLLLLLALVLHHASKPSRKGDS